jgi:hypothetical protein
MGGTWNTNVRVEKWTKILVTKPVVKRYSDRPRLT